MFLHTYFVAPKLLIFRRSSFPSEFGFGLFQRFLLLSWPVLPARRKSLGPADGLRSHVAVPPSAAGDEDASNRGGGTEPGNGMVLGLAETK